MVFNFLREELPIALLSFQEREGASRGTWSSNRQAVHSARARLGGVRGQRVHPGLPASAFSGGDRLYHRELVLTKSGESHF